MKYLLLTFLISAQVMAITGPGITDDPPTSSMERQEEQRRGYNSFPRDKVNEREDQEEKKVNPMTEKGPHGKEAQQGAKNKTLDDTNSEIKKKQKGH